MIDSVLSVFFHDTTSWFHIRQVAELAEVSPMTARKYLDKYKREGLLKYRESKLYKEYRSNLDSQEFRMRAGDYFAQRLHSILLIDYISKELGYPVIYLFGSAAKGEMGPRSDIDIFIFGEEKKELDLSKFEKKLGHKIQLFTYNQKEWETLTKKDPSLANNIITGRKLSIRGIKVF